MRDLFPGYYRPTDDNFTKLWTEAIFVFDTNVLLNLYSYPEEVRDVFLSVLAKLDNRIWIPYQVGLEFHRNRFARIKQSNQRVEKLLRTIRETGDQLGAEVKSIELEKRNIGNIDIQGRLTAVQEAHRTLSDAVQLACDKLPPISLDDPIGEKICQLLTGRVGAPPSDQAALDALLIDAQDRFDRRVPPGFADVSAKGDDTFRDREITYLRKFGDLILWRQILATANDKKISSIVFVTGDRKNDWWLFDDGKALGPLPELVQEITLKSPVELFWMYSSDQFLKYAETYLKATEVTPEAIEQVKELSAQHYDIANALRILGSDIQVPTQSLDQPPEGMDFSTWMDRLARVSNWQDVSPPSTPHAWKNRLSDLARGGFDSAEVAVHKWLVNNNSTSEVIENRGFPDFIVNTNGDLSGYEVKFLRTFSPRAFPPHVVNSLLRGYVEVNEGRLHDFSIIIVLPEDEADNFIDEEWLNDAQQRASRLLQKYPAHSIIFGFIFKGVFKPLIAIGGKHT